MGLVETLIFAPAWLHMALLAAVGLGALFQALAVQRNRARHIGRGLIVLFLALIGLGGAALLATAFGDRTSGHELGCVIGLSGYALSAVALLALLWLLLCPAIPRAAPRYPPLRTMVAPIGFGAVLLVVAFAIYARSLAFCIGSI